jgi:hypothetical protein
VRTFIENASGAGLAAHQRGDAAADDDRDLKDVADPVDALVGLDVKQLGEEVADHHANEAGADRGPPGIFCWPGSTSRARTPMTAPR